MIAPGYQGGNRADDSAWINTRADDIRPDRGPVAAYQAPADDTNKPPGSIILYRSRAPALQ